MKAGGVNALATSVIAFITVIGLMFGFYYNLKLANTRMLYIVIFELLFLAAVWFFAL